MKIIRVWLYSTREGIKYPDAKPSATNKLETKSVDGEFRYYRIEDEKTVFLSTRREADDWASESGKAVETLMGFPHYMHDLGYRY